MKSQLFVAGVVVALVASLVAAPQSMAKPGDLPAQNGIECSEGGDGPVKGKFSIELDFTAKGISLKFGAGLVKPTAGPTTTIDTVMPAFFDQVLAHVGQSCPRAIEALHERCRAAHENGFSEAQIQDSDQDKQEIDRHGAENPG